jgi:environmental stress-induced protein Ves
MSPPRVIELDRVATQPWRNGGGQTRELLAWPADAAPGQWLVRISVAEVDRDGPFSPFPHVQRWFVVVDGAGVALGLAAGEQLVTPASGPVCFDGAEAPSCRLLGGPTRDLNLMVRQGAGRATMRVVASGQRLPIGSRWQGLYTDTAVSLHAGGEPLAVPARSLVWSEAPASAWTLEAAGGSALRAWHGSLDFAR